MIRKIFKLLKVRTIKSYVYSMDAYVPYTSTNAFEFDLKVDHKSNKQIKYYIEEHNELIHQSYLYSKVFLMSLLRKNGPVIGNCFTNPKFRGLSIYPYVINQIAKITLESGDEEVFVIVDQSNIVSIKGIEKAGFKKYVAINTKRWLIFHLKPKINYY